MSGEKNHFISVNDEVNVFDSSGKDREDVSLVMQPMESKLKLGGVTIKLETPIHPIFYREFYKNYLKIEDELEDGATKNHLILSGLFIHLTFESLITYTIRTVINRVYEFKEQKIKTVWYIEFETKKLSEKLKFLQDSIITVNNFNSKSFKQLNDFVRKLASLRNKIVHGHEISQTSGTEIETKNTELLELLSVENMKGMYKGFWENIETFLDLFKNLIIPEGANLGNEFFDQIIKSQKEAMKEIEKKLEMN